jgi:dTDP-4-dehydrorhamnose reductase
MTPRLLITGAGGQLGQALTALAAKRGFEPVPMNSGALDIADGAAVADAAKGLSIDALINAAAYTAVDKAEEDEPRAFEVNADGPRHLAGAFGAKVPVIHVSTDYVFDGEGTRPYREHDETAPLGAYGRSKRAGERAVLAAPFGTVVRTAWVYSATGGNFLKTMLRIGRERGEAKVVDDQRGTPTHASDLAEALLLIAERQLAQGPGTAGLYHFTAAGETSWHGFAAEIFKALEAETGEKVLLSPVPSSAFPTKAKRPCYSVLDGTKIEKTFGVTRPDWKAAVRPTVAAVLQETT